MSSKEGEEGRSWGVHGVQREGLKGVPLQIFKAAGGDLLHVHHGAAGLKNTPRFAWASVCWAGWAAVNSKQGAGSWRQPSPFLHSVPLLRAPRRPGSQSALGFWACGQLCPQWPTQFLAHSSAFTNICVLKEWRWNITWGEGKVAKMATG